MSMNYRLLLASNFRSGFKLGEGNTNMVGNMRDWARNVIRCSLDIVGVVSMIDFYVGIVCVREGLDLNVVSPGSALSHLRQVGFVCCICFCFRGLRKSKGGREAASILSLWIPALPRPHGQERFELMRIVPHVLDHGLADFSVFGLVAIDLIG